MRRLLGVSLMFVVVGCQLSCRGGGQSVIGAWEIANMSRVTVPIDELPAASLAGGRMEFRADGTFAGRVVMPGAPQGVDMAGTYAVEGDVITIRNGLNNSATRSKMRFEKDYLVLEPAAPVPYSYTMYYRRVR